MSDPPWSRWWWVRCQAVRERRRGEHFWGRCDLRKGHDGDHMLDRGMDYPPWSTDWTDTGHEYRYESRHGT